MAWLGLSGNYDVSVYKVTMSMPVCLCIVLSLFRLFFRVGPGPMPSPVRPVAAVLSHGVEDREHTLSIQQ
jgi:hypothetical protein